MKMLNLTYIVDDDEIYLFALKRMMQLRKFCSEILTFSNGKEALNSLEERIVSNQSIPDVILLDLNMPVMDGKTFLKELTKIESHNKIFIYIISSSIDPADINRVNEFSNVKKYKVKPIPYENYAHS